MQILKEDSEEEVGGWMVMSGDGGGSGWRVVESWAFSLFFRSAFFPLHKNISFLYRSRNLKQN